MYLIYVIIKISWNQNKRKQPNYNNFALSLIAQQAAQQAAQLEIAGGQPTNTNALAIRRPFDPRAHDLDAHFRLTRFADLKGWGCKVPQDVLLKLLEGLQDDANSQEEHHFMHMAIPRIGEFFFLKSISHKISWNQFHITFSPGLCWYSPGHFLA